jgi:hypothetical protein
VLDLGLDGGNRSDVHQTSLSGDVVPRPETTQPCAIVSP